MVGTMSEKTNGGGVVVVATRVMVMRMRVLVETRDEWRENKQ